MHRTDKWLWVRITTELSGCGFESHCCHLETYVEGLFSYSHMTFNQVVLLDHVAVWKIYISTFTTLMAAKLGKVLTTGRSFSMQMLKSSPTSCFFFSLLGLFLDGLIKVICKFLFYCRFNHMWPRSNLWTWHAVCFQSMSFRHKH